MKMIIWALDMYFLLFMLILRMKKVLISFIKNIVKKIYFS